MRRAARAALILALVGLVWAAKPIEFWVGAKGKKVKVRLSQEKGLQGAKEAVCQVLKRMIEEGRDETWFSRTLLQKGIVAFLSKDGNTYEIYAIPRPSGERLKEMAVGEALFKKGSVLDYPVLPLVHEIPGSVNGSEVKEVKLDKDQFAQLWGQIMESTMRLTFSEDEKQTRYMKDDFVGAAVYASVFNMSGFKNAAARWVQENEDKLDSTFAHYFPEVDYDIGQSGWSAAVSPTRIQVIRQISGQKYIVGEFISMPRAVAKALADEKWDLYVFNKHMKNSKGKDINLDFAVLRLKDAYKYGFSDASERFDLYMPAFTGSLHNYVEVPKGYEVVGVMPDISKDVMRLDDGENVNTYTRALYFALEDRSSKRKAIFGIMVVEHKYGISVYFLYVTQKSGDKR